MVIYSMVITVIFNLFLGRESFYICLFPRQGFVPTGTNLPKEWFEKQLELTAYQKSKLYSEETFRWAPFYFVIKGNGEQYKGYWRLTLPLWWLYFIVLVLLILPIKWLINGRWGIEHRQAIYQFHYNWAKRLGL